MGCAHARRRGALGRGCGASLVFLFTALVSRRRSAVVRNRPGILVIRWCRGKRRRSRWRSSRPKNRQVEAVDVFGDLQQKRICRAQRVGRLSQSVSCPHGAHIGEYSETLTVSAASSSAMNVRTSVCTVSAGRPCFTTVAYIVLVALCARRALPRPLLTWQCAEEERVRQRAERRRVVGYACEDVSVRLPACQRASVPAPAPARCSTQLSEHHGGERRLCTYSWHTVSGGRSSRRAARERPATHRGATRTRASCNKSQLNKSTVLLIGLEISSGCVTAGISTYLARSFCTSEVIRCPAFLCGRLVARRPLGSCQVQCREETRKGWEGGEQQSK